MISKINYSKIQKLYDKGLSYRKIIAKLKISSKTISNGVKKGLLKTRTKSEAKKLHDKLYGPNKHSETTKKKLSRIRTKFLKENPSKVPYLLNHSSKGRSYPEQYFYEWLINNKISFEEQKQVSIYQLDFVINSINLEIDGEQHYLDPKVIKSNKKRNKFLKQKGFKTIRVRWASFKRKSLKQKKVYLKNLKNKLCKLSTY